MSEEKILHEGTISDSLRRKELFKTVISFAAITLTFIVIVSILLIASSNVVENSSIPKEVEEALENRGKILVVISFFAFFMTIIIAVSLIINYIYYTAYIRNFSFKITETSIIIKYGILEKNLITIPFSRVQNISLVQGVFDRMFKTHTFSLETAGSSGKVMKVHGQGKSFTVGSRAEGYIPGLKDPWVIEKIVKKKMDAFSHAPSGMEDKFLKPKELAFDNFVSLLLSGMESSNKVEVSLRSERQRLKLSVAELAERSGVHAKTIIGLERGDYAPRLILARKLAEALRCNINDLFKLK